MSKNVHIVPHMHWDREWYFTTEESRILLINNMEEIMSMLEENEHYPYYILDGQTAVLEDYFTIKPENIGRVKKLVQAGKLIVGPWYTQTDEMVVGGESIVRNLLYGLKDSKKLGEPMMIGYLPDSFGQSEKLPQILNGFRIDRCIFWRGASERHGSTKHNFRWKSNSEGEVIVHLMPLGYAIGKYLPDDKEALSKRMDKYLPVLDKGAVNDEILLPNGHDQMPIQQNIFKVMEMLSELYPDRKFFLSRYEHVFEELEKVNDLDTLQGELLDGKYMRVHRSIFSSRADLKSSNTRIENRITNVLEPLASIAYRLGAVYEEGLIESIWKEMLKNHAHDSIGCCCSDKVHRDVENRFWLAEDKTEELIRFYMRKIVDAMNSDVSLDKLTVFNFLPYDRAGIIEGKITTKFKNFNLLDDGGKSVPFTVTETEIIDAGLIDRQIVHYGDYDPFIEYTLCIEDTIPAMGYKTYFIKEIEALITVENVQTHKNTLENEFYHIKVHENGSLEITEKESGRVYQNALTIEDASDDGDEYDYSPLPDDFIILSTGSTSGTEVKANIAINCFKLKSELRIDYKMAIPKDLESRKVKTINSIMGISMKLVLKKRSPIIELEVTIDNQSKDHRVRILIPNQLSTQFSVADNQFGVMKRPVRDTAMDVWETEQWDERPDSIYPMLSYVGLDNSEGLSFLTNSVREYEIIGEKYDTLAVTLFRGVAFLGKEKLLRRPGRPSGIKMPTPNAQLIGVQKYSLAIVRNQENLAKMAKEYVTSVVYYNKMPYNAMKLNQPSFNAPANYSMLNVDKETFILSALKKAEGKEHLIMRGYQTIEEEMSVEIAFEKGVCLSSEVNLNEDKISDMTEMKLTIPKNVIKGYGVVF